MQPSVSRQSGGVDKDSKTPKSTQTATLRLHAGEICAGSRLIHGSEPLCVEGVEGGRGRRGWQTERPGARAGVTPWPGGSRPITCRRPRSWGGRPWRLVGQAVCALSRPSPTCAPGQSQSAKVHVRFSTRARLPPVHSSLLSLSVSVSILQYPPASFLPANSGCSRRQTPPSHPRYPAAATSPVALPAGDRSPSFLLSSETSTTPGHPDGHRRQPCPAWRERLIASSHLPPSYASRQRRGRDLCNCRDPRRYRSRALERRL